MKRVLMIGLMLLFTSCGMEIVDTGFRGVETKFGKVVGGSLDEGLHFYNPITSNIIEMDVRVQKTNLKTSAYSKDAQIVEVTYTTNFYPVKSAVHEFYQNVGVDWSNKLLPQVLEGTVKEIIGQYNAVKLISNRNEAVERIKALILKRLKDLNVNMTNFQIENFDFNDAFEKAVEKKVIAVQEAEEAKNKTVRIKEEANQKIISAEAIARSMKIRAKALESNKSLIEYEAVQKWDGKLPEIMTGNGVMPFLNIKKKN